MTIKTCRHCDIRFNRDDAAPIPHDRCERCHEEIEALDIARNQKLFGRSAAPPAYDLADAWDAGEERIDAIGINGNDGLAYPDPQLHKQVRYRDSEGEDWIDEFARTSTPEEFRGAMRFTVGKYVRRVGRKDSELSEVRKMRDYCQRWEQYEQELEQ